LALIQPTEGKYLNHDEDLAKRLGVRPRQVQNNEATNYESASLSRLQKTAEILRRARNKQGNGKPKTKARGG
jgi:hypothetical protein